MGCEVQQCCCGCTLKTGSMAIGIVEAVFCGIGMVVFIMAAVGFAVLRDTVINNSEVTEEQIEAFHAAMGALSIMMIVVSVIVVVQLVFSILLACGASHENPSLIKPWIIYSIVWLVLSIIMNIISASVAFANGLTGSGVQSLLVCAVAAALKIYFIVVVRSFHLQLTRPGAVKTFA